MMRDIMNIAGTQPCNTVTEVFQATQSSTSGVDYPLSLFSPEMLNCSAQFLEDKRL